MSLIDGLLVGDAKKLDNARGSFIAVAVDYLQGDSRRGALYAVARSYEVNGDLIPDPDVEFFVVDEPRLRDILAPELEKSGRRLRMENAFLLPPAGSERGADPWERIFGRPPTDGDLVVPTRNMTMRESPEAQRALHDDRAVLELRPRRGHDLRRTFITLAQVDGAQKDRFAAPQGRQ
jgi:hypothetical protein